MRIAANILPQVVFTLFYLIIFSKTICCFQEDLLDYISTSFESKINVDHDWPLTPSSLFHIYHLLTRTCTHPQSLQHQLPQQPPGRRSLHHRSWLARPWISLSPSLRVYVFRCHAKGNDGPEELLFDHRVRVSGPWRYGTDNEAENSFAEEICDGYVECRYLHSRKHWGYGEAYAWDQKNANVYDKNPGSCTIAIAMIKSLGAGDPLPGQPLGPFSESDILTPYELVEIPGPLTWFRSQCNPALGWVQAGEWLFPHK